MRQLDRVVPGHTHAIGGNAETCCDRRSTSAFTQGEHLDPPQRLATHRDERGVVEWAEALTDHRDGDVVVVGDTEKREDPTALCRIGIRQVAAAEDDDGRRRRHRPP